VAREWAKGREGRGNDCVWFWKSWDIPGVRKVFGGMNEVPFFYAVLRVVKLLHDLEL
jgi:hypothetical protein